jgi:hypothetical protein
VSYDAQAQTWDPASDPLRAAPDALSADVSGILPEPLSGDAAAADVAAVTDEEFARLLPTVRLLSTLSRIGEAGAEALSRPRLDAAARLLGFGRTYSDALPDADLRALLLNADAYHAERGTPAGMERAARDLAGQAPQPDGPAVEVVEQGTARGVELGALLPALGHWAEAWVVIWPDRVTTARWDASVGRSLRHAAAAGVRLTYVLPIPDAHRVENGGDPLRAAEALAHHARTALGRGHRVWTLPTMGDGLLMDGTYTMAPYAVVARPAAEFLPVTAGPAPSFAVLAVDEEAGTATLRGRDGAGFVVTTQPVTYRGQDYAVGTARPVPYAAVHGAAVTAETVTLPPPSA